MKVIDLLNKISNREEVPNKIQVYSDIYVLNSLNMTYENERTGTNLLSVYNGYILNHEVKTKEYKKIEKLYICERASDTLIGKSEKRCYATSSLVNKEIANKINKVIDILNEMREDK